jgi:hypothetical protein
MVRNRGVEVVVLEIRAQMEARCDRRVVDHEAIGIGGLEPVHRAAQPGAILGAVHEVGAPVLVDDGPAEDRRVIAVALENAPQRRLRPRARPRGQPAGVRQLGPDQQPDPVGDRVVAGIGHLDVAAQAVEPERLRLAELILEERLRWRRADPVRVVVLIQRPAQEQRLAVEVDAPRTGLDRAEAEALPDDVGHVAGAPQQRAQFIEVRRIRRPVERLRNAQRRARSLLTRAQDQAGGFDGPAIGTFDLQLEVVRDRQRA